MSIYLSYQSQNKEQMWDREKIQDKVEAATDNSGWTDDTKSSRMNCRRAL